MPVRQCTAKAVTTGMICTHQVDDRSGQCAAGHPNPYFHYPALRPPEVAAVGAAPVADVEALLGSATSTGGAVEIARCDRCGFEEESLTAIGDRCGFDLSEEHGVGICDGIFVCATRPAGSR